MAKFIEAIANADFNAILTLITTFLTSGFGIALTIVANKFLKYKKSVSEIADKTKENVVPSVKEIIEQVKVEIIDELRADFKVVAESIALSVANDSKSKLAVVENISKIGASKEITDSVVKVVEQEVQTKEEQKKEIEKVITKLENNNLETL